jgi:hypothetical protein
LEDTKRQTAVDAFTHLDMSVADPIADLQSRMAAAAVDRALVVETWSGDNRHCLDTIANSAIPEFRVALCYRPELNDPEFLAADRIVALRVKTSDLVDLGKVGDGLQASGNWLMVHAENGIAGLTNELGKVARQFPQLKIYVPHLAWPRRDGVDDPNWGESIAALSRIPGLVLGISAMAHFSRESFPHRDVEGLASRAVQLFPSERVAVASDYPLFEKSLYGEYMRLAEDWVRSIHPNWSTAVESAIFNPRG